MIDLIALHVFGALSLPLQKYTVVHSTGMGYVLTGMRIFISGIPSILLLKQPSNHVMQPWHVQPQKIIVVLWYGAALGCGTYLKYVAKQVGLAHTSLVHAYMMQAMAPIIICVLQVLKGSERFTTVQWVGVYSSVCGMIVPLFMLSVTAMSVKGISVWGGYVMMSAVFMHCLGVLAMKNLSEQYQQNSLYIHTFCSLGGGLLLIATGLWIGGSSVYYWNNTIIVCFLCNIGVTSLFRFLYYEYMLKKYSASLLVITEHSSVIGTVAYSWIFFSELPTIATVFGVGGVLAGISLFHYHANVSSHIGLRAKQMFSYK